MNTANKRFIKHKKHLRALSLILVLLLIGAGTTYAFEQRRINKQNILRTHSVEVAIIETPDTGFAITPGAPVSKNVKFANTANAAVFLRVSYAEVWRDKDENWLEHKAGYAVPHWTDTGAPDSGIDSDLWFDGSDGWFYYKKVLPSGGQTEAIMDYVSFEAGLPETYREGCYELLWLAEVVQFSTDETRTQNQTVNEAALAAVFGRTALVSGVQVSDGAVVAAVIGWQ